MPTCPNHPDRETKSKGLCATCYMRLYRKGTTEAKTYGESPICHPDRKLRGNGLCAECYNKQYWKTTHPDAKPQRKFAECHPDRPHIARGLCLECYRKEPDQQTYTKQYSITSAPRQRELKLKRLYNLTSEGYDQLFKDQHGVCAICEVRKPSKNRLSVDHDHNTNTVRGLLCVPCNRALGYFENPDWREKAQRYLNLHA